jgi:hypothetical protein
MSKFIFGSGDAFLLIFKTFKRWVRRMAFAKRPNVILE